MKRLTIISALIFSLSILVQNAESAPFRVGVVLPLSGDMKEYGTAALRGIEMARKDLQDRLGNVEFEYEDGRYDPASATRATQFLLSQGPLDTLFIWGDYPAEALVPLAEKQGIPTFVGTITSDLVKGSNYSVRFISSADDFTAPLYQYMNQKGLKKVAIVFTQDPYCVKLTNSIRRNISAENLVDVEEVDMEETDFRSIISRMRRTNPDVVAVYLMPGQTGTFFRQAKGLQFEPVFFGGDTFESETEIKGAEGAMEGAIYSDNIVLPGFKTRYIEEFKNDSQITYAANGYAFVELIAGTLARKSAPVAAPDIMSVYRSAGTINSKAAGDFSFSSADGDVTFRFPVGLKQVKGASHVTLEGTVPIKW